MLEKKFYVGLDLGQATDYSALCVVEKDILQLPESETEEARKYFLLYLERFPLHTSYPTIIEKVIRILRRSPLVDYETTLIIDSSGVGKPILDSFREKKLKTPIVGIVITGGDSPSKDGRDYRVPKKDLVSNAQLLLQSRYLQFAKGISLEKTLIDELLNFQIKVTPSANLQFEARSGVNDDLVLSLCIALWYAEKVKPFKFQYIGGAQAGKRPVGPTLFDLEKWHSNRQKLEFDK